MLIYMLAALSLLAWTLCGLRTRSSGRSVLQKLQRRWMMKRHFQLDPTFPPCKNLIVRLQTLYLQRPTWKSTTHQERIQCVFSVRLLSTLCAELTILACRSHLGVRRQWRLWVQLSSFNCCDSLPQQASCAFQQQRQTNYKACGQRNEEASSA